METSVNKGRGTKSKKRWKHREKRKLKKEHRGERKGRQQSDRGESMGKNGRHYSGVAGS